MAIDDEANIHVIELKRDRTPRDVVGQVLDYGSWVETLTEHDFEEIFEHHNGHSLSQAFRDRFGLPLPSAIGRITQLVIVASELDDSSERIVEYLQSSYGININVVFFRFFESADGEYVSRTWLSDPEDIREHVEAKSGRPWEGHWHMNVGEGPHRNWQDCRQYSFLSAGQGPNWREEARKLSPGDRVFAYLDGAGYVGHGIVQRKAVPVREFKPPGSDRLLLEHELTQPNIGENADNDEMCDWPIAMKWIDQLDRSLAMKPPKTIRGTVRKIRSAEVVDFLKSSFKIEGS